MTDTPSASTPDEATPSAPETSTPKEASTTGSSSGPASAGRSSASTGAIPEIESMVAELWVSSLQDAYRAAFNQRLRDLRGDRVSRFALDGIHDYSHQWGIITACEVLVDGLAQLRVWRDADPGYCNPYSLREVAERDADRQFAVELLDRYRKEQE